ncbi:MAG: hypothetical protein DDT39_01680 [Firmicutes bacterium]|nr:hypothetical protein [candidate division NPL-UPA2 bacterium]
MAIQESQVKAGAYFITSTDQLRKVSAVDHDEHGGKRVHYLSKSKNFIGRKFEIAHTKANPPKIETFLADCDHELVGDELEGLRKANVILSGE